MRAAVMHCAKQHCIGHDAHVPVATLAMQMLNANQMRNAMQAHRRGQMIYESPVRVMAIARNRLHAAHTANASIHAIPHILHASQINVAKHGAIGQCAFANLALL